MRCSQTTLQIHLYDEDPLFDDLIQTIVIDVNTLTEGKTQIKEFAIQPVVCMWGWGVGGGFRRQKGSHFIHPNRVMCNVSGPHCETQFINLKFILSQFEGPFKTSVHFKIYS